MALRATMPAVLMFGFLHGLGSSRQPSENSLASANEFVRQVVGNEIKAENQDHSHWAFRLQTEKGGRTEIDEVVETKDGNVQLPLSVNGRPLTAKQKEQASLHLKKLVHDPDALRRSLREENEDTARTQNLLKLLPDAFIFSYDGPGAGDFVKVKFSPNPHFRPPSRDAQVFHAMEGEMTSDGRQLRLAEISGHLLHEVKFGGGLLGRLDKGGQFSVKQEQISPGLCELTALNVQMQGKTLFFKTISVQQKMLRSSFRRVSDDLTVAQAADMLGKSAPDSNSSTRLIENSNGRHPRPCKPVLTMKLESGRRATIELSASRTTLLNPPGLFDSLNELSGAVACLRCRKGSSGVYRMSCIDLYRTMA